MAAGLKDMRDRIGSVKNTQKITDAMKLVAAAKVRRAQEAVVNGRPFAENLVKVRSAHTPAPMQGRAGRCGREPPEGPALPDAGSVQRSAATTAAGGTARATAGAP